MQSLLVYYYPNTVEVQLNLDPTTKLRNRVMYKRTVKLYKGIDNVVQFIFKNSDSKTVNITGWDVKFNMISDEEGTIVLSTPVTVIDANTGIVTATLKELDLIDLNNVQYNYSLSITNHATGQEQVVYTDDNYSARGEIELLDGHYPTFKPSINVTIPTSSNSTIFTSSVAADTPARQMSSHHTAQFYFDNFTGAIDVQATLDPIPPNGWTSGNTSVSWSTVSTLSYANQNTTDYYNWDGVYSACRFVISPSVGSVTKSLYRA